eukprot:8127451-Lingulodinium_polyedra.AAC.1
MPAALAAPPPAPVSLPCDAVSPQGPLRPQQLGSARLRQGLASSAPGRPPVAPPRRPPSCPRRRHGGPHCDEPRA